MNVNPAGAGSLVVVSHSVADTHRLASQLCDVLRPGDLVLLCGDLGTGKTAFTKGLAASLGIDDQVTSPTFVLVQTYDGPVPIVHVDVYRLEHAGELEALALEELLDETAIGVIEWGDRFAAHLPPDRLEIMFSPGAGIDDRTVVLVPQGPSWHARRRLLAELVEGF